jgi:hypothetical protein
VRKEAIDCEDVPTSLILFILSMQAKRSSETYVATKPTRRQIPEDGILRLLSHPPTWPFLFLLLRLFTTNNIS